jgi:proteasome alpha subunit
MSMPFYVSPEQLMKDRADYARKGIARGRSVVVLQYDDGIAFATENPSRALHKISEIYDRIAFAAVGKYNEFENLRVAGVRYADLRGYSYDRVDVTARGLANAYAQTLGAVFTTESKPLEVELVVAEVGRTPDDDQLYRLSSDGSVAEERGWVVMGGQAERLGAVVEAGWQPRMTLAAALELGVRALGAPGDDAGAQRTFTPAQLEVAVLDRTRPRRAFRRLTGELLADVLGATAGAAAADTAPGEPATPA